MRSLTRIFAILCLALLAAEALAGNGAGSGIRHPPRRALSPELVAEADATFERVHSARQDFEVVASDGARLRGWKVRTMPRIATGDWVLLYHGQSDNRAGRRRCFCATAILCC